jgi:hypothetical protein
VSYRAKLSGITNDNFSASFSILTPNAELESIRVYLYRRVEWIWEVEKDKEEGLAAISPSPTRVLPRSLLTETAPMPSVVMNVPTIQFANDIGDHLNTDADWDYVASLFRTAAPIARAGSQALSWREYVQDIARVTRQDGHAGATQYVYGFVTGCKAAGLIFCDGVAVPFQHIREIPFGGPRSRQN